MRVLAAIARIAAVSGLSLLVLTRAAPGLARILRSWGPRVAVDGMSMSPALLPGDWLLVDPRAYARRPPRPGELVVVPDPRAATRLLVKRVMRADGISLEIGGDAAAHRAHAAGYGPVNADTVLGAPWFRYWPPHRMGTLAPRR